MAAGPGRAMTGRAPLRARHFRQACLATTEALLRQQTIAGVSTHRRGGSWVAFLYVACRQGHHALLRKINLSRRAAANLAAEREAATVQLHQRFDEGESKTGTGHFSSQRAFELNEWQQHAFEIGVGNADAIVDDAQLRTAIGKQPRR